MAKEKSGTRKWEEGVQITADDLILFIDDLRRNKDFNIGSQQYIAAQDVFVALIAREGEITDRNRLKRLIGPLLCTSSKEQEAFGYYFDQAFPEGQAAPYRVRALLGQKLSLEEEVDEIARENRLVKGVGALIALPLLALLVYSLVPQPVEVETLGTFSLHTHPAGAWVIALGDSSRAGAVDTLGRSPLLFKPLPLGVHSLRIHWDSLAHSVDIKVAIKPEHTELDMLRLAFGKLAYPDSNATEGVALTLNGRGMVTFPDSLPVGHHRVHLSKQGFLSIDTTLVVEPGDSLEMPLAFEQIRYGSIVVASQPDSVHVFLGNERIGLTSIETPLVIDSIEIGPRRLRLEREGYRKIERSIYIREREDGDGEYFRYVLEPNVGALIVRANQSGAQVFIDDNPVGEIGVRPLFVNNIVWGSRTLKITKRGYEDFETTVAIGVGDTLSVAATLNESRQFTYNVAFSPDGDTLLVGDPDTTMIHWSVNGQIPVGSLNDPAMPLTRKVAGQQSEIQWSDVSGWERMQGTLNKLEWHSEAVFGVAFSPDGKMLASASADHTVRLWDTGTWARLATLIGHEDLVEGIAFSPDARVLASASSDHTVRLWDTSTGAAMATLVGHSDIAIGVAFSPDGKVLASTSEDHTVRLWDTSTGAAMDTLVGHSDIAIGVAFSPDGEILASTSNDGTTRLWRPDTGAEVAILSDDEEEVFSAAFSPDGKFLASVSMADDAIRIWDVSTGVVLDTLIGHEEAVYGIDFSPDGKMLASASEDGTIRLWSPGTGAEIARLHWQSGVLIDVAFSPDGKMLAAALLDGTIRLWRQNNKGEFIGGGHSDDVYGVAFSPDGKTVASASEDGTTRLWSTSSVDEIATLAGHADDVIGVAFSPDGKMLATSSLDETIRLWNTSTGGVIDTLFGHSEFVFDVVFSADGKTLVSSSEDGTILLWSKTTGEVVDTLVGPTDSVYGLSISPDGKTLASSSADETIRLWDTSTWTVTHTLTGHEDVVVGNAFSLDGKTLASSSADETIRLWDVNTGSQIALLTGHSDDVIDVAFSPDGKTLASASLDRTIRLWDLSTRVEVAILRVSGTVYSVAFSPDGSMLSAGFQEGIIPIWKKKDPEVPWQQELVADLAFKSDLREAVSVSEDGKLVFWDAVRQTETHTIQRHEGRVLSVAYGMDNKVVASGNENGEVYLTPVFQVADVWDTIHYDYVRQIALSPDGAYMAASRDAALTITRLSDGRMETFAFPGEEDEGSSPPISDLAFSKDGLLLMIGRGDLLYLQNYKRSGYFEEDKLGRLGVFSYPEGTFVSDLALHPERKSLIMVHSDTAGALGQG